MAAASTATTGHVRKRQYQPSIKSFFNASENGPLSQQRSAPSLSPPLPADTQASLLSVGMRVRKSVPEGYKTHKTLGSPGFPVPSTAPPPSTKPVTSGYSNTRSQELMPFCGLHKTGGWAAQEVPPSSAPAALQRTDSDGDDDDDGDMAAMTMSQSTLLSSQGSFASSSSAQPGGPRKRTYEEEVEDNMDAFFDEMMAADSMEQETPRPNRPIARMKPTLRKAAADGAVQWADGEDFEDAAFLKPPESMRMDET